MLKIYDNKNRNKSYCTITKPNLVNYFTTDNEQTHIIRDTTGLKYIPECYLKGNRISKNHFINIRYKQPLIYELPLNLLWAWIEENENQLYIQNTDFVTYNNVLSNILITPFRQRKCQEFFIKAKLKHEKILLYEEKSIVEIHDSYNNSYKHNCENKYRLYNYRRCLFNNKPLIEEPMVLQISNKSTKNLFYEIFEIKINNHKVIYVNEVDGVHSDHMITNLNELKLANHFEAVLYYKHRKYYEWKQRRQEKFDRALTLWAKCKFNLSGQIIIANYNYKMNIDNLFVDGEHNVVQHNIVNEKLTNMKTMNVDRLPRQCAKIWNPTKAIRFLNEFLNTVKKTVRNDGLSENELNTTEWIFKCSPNYEISVDIVNDT